MLASCLHSCLHSCLTSGKLVCLHLLACILAVAETCSKTIALPSTIHMIPMQSSQFQIIQGCPCPKLGAATTAAGTSLPITTQNCPNTHKREFLLPPYQPQRKRLISMMASRAAAAGSSCQHYVVAAGKPTLTPQQFGRQVRQLLPCHGGNWLPLPPLGQHQRMQQSSSSCSPAAALPASWDGLSSVAASVAVVAAPLQQDQVAVAITLAVALTWVKLFDVLTSSGVLEQVRRCRSVWWCVCARCMCGLLMAMVLLCSQTLHPPAAVVVLCPAEAEPEARACHSWPNAVAVLAHLQVSCRACGLAPAHGACTRADAAALGLTQ